MITQVESRKQLDSLLIKEGWKIGQNDRFLLCPFDQDIRYNRKSGVIFTGVEYSFDYTVFAKISNIKDIVWKYDDVTGLLSNPVMAVRVK